MKIGIFNIYFYPLRTPHFGIQIDYKLLEISLVWYNLIIDWQNTEDDYLDDC